MSHQHIAPGQAASASLRPGTMDFYLVRTLFAPFLLIELGMILLLELERALRLIYELSLAGADITYFVPLLLRLAPYFVNLALPPAFFLALTILLARLDERLELQAMLAIGMPIGRIALPLVAAGLVVSVLSVATSGWLEPYGRYDFRRLKVEALNSGRTARLAPGAYFTPSPNLAISIAPSDKDMSRGVFVWHRDANGRQQTIAAQAAVLGQSSDGQRIEMALRNGTVIADDPRSGHGGAHSFEFQQFTSSFPMLLDNADWQRGRDERELTTPELFAPGPERSARLGRDAIDAELYGRLGKAALIPLLPLLVLPLTMAVRRARRLPTAMVAGVLFILALYAVNTVRQAAAVGKIAALPSVMLVVAVFSLIEIGVILAGRSLPSHSPMSDLLDRLDHLMKGVTRPGRMQLALPGHLVVSYLWGRVLLWTIISGVALVAMLEMGEIFLLGDAFVRRGMGLIDVIRYGWLRFPAQALQALPIAAMIGPVVAFLLLVRNREMMIIRLMGISPLRLLFLLLPIPLLLGAVTWGLSEHVVPRSQKALLGWWQFDAPGAEPVVPRWFGVGNTLVRAESISSASRRLDKVLLVERAASGAIVRTIEAPHAVALADGWRLDNAAMVTIDHGIVQRSAVPVHIWKTSLRPDDARAAMAAGENFSASWARRALDGDAPASAGIAAYHTRILRQATMPLLPLIMLIFALPITATSHNGRRTALAAAFAVTAGSVFLVTDSLMTVMAMLGNVPPLVGAWLVPIEAAMLGLLVLGLL